MVARPRDERVADEAAALGSREKPRTAPGRRGHELDLDLRLDADERVPAVPVALRHGPVRAPRSGDVEMLAGVWSRLVSEQRTSPARRRCSADQGSAGDRAPPAAAARGPVAVDRDVEFEHAGVVAIAVSVPRRPVRGLGCGRMEERLRTLSEAECYERCYGWRWSRTGQGAAARAGPARSSRPRSASASAGCSSSGWTPASPKPPERGAVPDVLGPGVRVVFCGINPGHLSAAAGAAFANPRNDFWRLLHAAGFTPRLLEPQEQSELSTYGVGLTNAA